MYAVTVTFEIKPGQADAFLPLMVENARASMRDEPGCQQFDVCRGADSNVFFLYEIYDDEASFQAHLASAHYQTFDAAVADMVAGKDARTFGEVIR